MRDCIKDFVEIVSHTLPINEPIYEFGALQVPGQEGYADLRPYFPGRKYVGCDLREGTGVDAILDLAAIDLPDNTAGMVIILDTVEHVEYFRKAIDEAHRILKHDGMLVISSVMNFEIHEYPFDFWRFTPQGFESLLKPFPTAWVNFAGEDNFPHTVVGVAFKSEVEQSVLDPFIEKAAAWKTGYFHQYGPPPEPGKKRKKSKNIFKRIRNSLREG